MRKNLSITIGTCLALIYACSNNSKVDNQDSTSTDDLEQMIDSVWVWNPETEKEELTFISEKEETRTQTSFRDGIDSIFIYDPKKDIETLTVIKYTDGVPDTLKYP